MRVSAKKKNDGDPLAEEYPLPQLPDSFTPAAGAQATPTAARAANVGNATVQSTDPPRAESRPAAVQTHESHDSTKQPQGADPVRSDAAAPIHRHASVSGLSISSLMNSASAPSQKPSENKTEKAVRTETDPQSSQKIERCRKQVIERILEERPRFVVAFENMRVDGHTIRVEVPSRTLYEEIMRCKTEVLTVIARTAGVNGSLDLAVEVNEQIKAARPIKLEDRIKFMTEKNSLILELKKALDMEYE